MVTIPDDYFDYPPNEPIIPKIGDFALDYKRLVDTGVLCRSKFARLFDSVSIKTKEHFDINCKSWRCVKHRQAWGKKWCMCLEERLKELKIHLLVNLTTAEMIDNEITFKALRRFMQKFRVHFGPTEYLKVVEYNKKKTQPHFHLLISNYDLNLSTMPQKFRGKEGKNLSWPYNIYSWIKQTWGDCLEYFAPGLHRTNVVWCQPPGNSQASSKYAIGYVTGKSNKDEEPDNTWKGRKLTYSKKFWDKPASEVWKELLIQMFGERDPEDKFFWVPNELERLPGENPLEFANCAIMKQRFFEAEFYTEYGFFPVIVDPVKFDPVYYYIQDNEDGTMQEYFNSQELKT